MDTNSVTASRISEDDYLALEAALIATAKGRMFLCEYVARNRAPDTQRLLRSIARLHKVTIGPSGLGENVLRDLEAVLGKFRSLRSKIPAAVLGQSEMRQDLHHIEAALLALSEQVQDCDEEPNLYTGLSLSWPDTQSEKLFGELSTLFAHANLQEPSQLEI